MCYACIIETLVHAEIHFEGMDPERDKITPSQSSRNSFDEETQITLTKLHPSPSDSKKKFPDFIQTSQNGICLEEGPHLASDGVKTFHNNQSSICSFVSTYIPSARDQSQIYFQTLSFNHEPIYPISKGSKNLCRSFSSSFSKFGSKTSRSYVPTKCLQKPNVTISESCHFKKVKRNKLIFSPKSNNLAILVQNKLNSVYARRSHTFGFRNGKCKSIDLIKDLSQATVLLTNKFGSLKFEKHSSSTSKSPYFKLSCKKCSVVLNHKKPVVSFNSIFKMNRTQNDLVKSNSFKINCLESGFGPLFSKSDPQFFCKTPSVCQEIKFLGSVDIVENSKLFCDILNDCKIRIDVQGGGHHYPRRCDKCHKMYSHSSSFSKHITSGKCKKETEGETSFIVCSKCSVAYTSPLCYQKHLRRKSCPNFKYTLIPCLEPSCEIKFRLQSVMMQHLVVGHGIDLGIQKKTFVSMEEFEEWKMLEERQTFTMLTKRRRDYTVGGKNGKMSYYYSCIFNVQERRKVPIRKYKISRPVIENTNCPAKIDALEGPDGIQVTYYSYHNHDLTEENLKFCRVPQKTRKYIDRLIEDKVPTKKIIEELATHNLDSEGPHPLKEHFITLKEIRRMKNRLTAMRKMSKEDALSVELLINVLYADKPDSILIYKPQGKAAEIGSDFSKLLSGHDLFVLGIQEERQRLEMTNNRRKVLCIDTNHLPKLYNFYLINVFIQDEYDEGYPVAHFIMNRFDSNILTALFSALKSKSPHLEINAFMTNDNPILYNAFSQVFENKPIHFLCKSNLKRSWFNQLKEKVKDPVLVSEIHSSLEAILEENNYETFLETLTNFPSKYESICPDFCQKFSTYYAKNSESWAMCFRNLPYAAADSSVFCEFFHKRLRLAYVNRKVKRKVGDLIEILSDVDNNFHLALSYKRFTNEVPASEDNENHCRHWKGMSVSDNDVIKSGVSNFKVKSESICHTVTVISDRCSVPSICYIQCHKPPCYPLCCHMYSCSCEDKNALCQHIHKVHCLKKSRSSSNDLEKSKDESDDSDNELSSSDVLKKQVPCPKPSDDEKLLTSTETALSELRLLLTNPKMKTLSHHISNTLKSLVTECNGLLSGKQVSRNISDTLPVQPPNSDHTYIDPTKKVKSRTNNPCPTKKIMVVDRTAIPAVRDSRKRTVIRLPLGNAPEQSNNFSGTLQPTDSLTKPLFKSSRYEIKLYHLKSLDPCLSDQDLSRIQSEVPDFKKGCLYDCIIYSYLLKISELFPLAKIVAPSVSQILASSKSDILIMIPIAEYEKILILCNPDDTHWLLLVVYPALKEVHFLDPECPIIKECYHQFIGRWVKVLSKNSGVPIPEWKVRAPVHICQSDSINCGVFVSWFADQILKNLPTVALFSVEMYRKKMYETLKALVSDTTT